VLNCNPDEPLRVPPSPGSHGAGRPRDCAVCLLGSGSDDVSSIDFEGPLAAFEIDMKAVAALQCGTSWRHLEAPTTRRYDSARCWSEGSRSAPQSQRGGKTEADRRLAGAVAFLLDGEPGVANAESAARVP